MLVGYRDTPWLRPVINSVKKQCLCAALAHWWQAPGHDASCQAEVVTSRLQPSCSWTWPCMLRKQTNSRITGFPYLNKCRYIVSLWTHHSCHLDPSALVSSRPAWSRPWEPSILVIFGQFDSKYCTYNKKRKTGFDQITGSQVNHRSCSYSCWFPACTVCCSNQHLSIFCVLNQEQLSRFLCIVRIMRTTFDLSTTDTVLKVLCQDGEIFTILSKVLIFLLYVYILYLYILHI